MNCTSEHVLTFCSHSLYSVTDIDELVYQSIFSNDVVPERILLREVCHFLFGHAPAHHSVLVLFRIWYIAIVGRGTGGAFCIEIGLTV